MNGNAVRNYFILNKTSDFKRGYLENIRMDGGRLHLEAPEGAPARMLSRVFDGNEKELQWHRFRVQCSGENLNGRMAVYASESPFLASGDGTISIDECIRTGSLSLQEKLVRMEPCKKKEASFFDDVLLHDVFGRYLWFYMEWYPRKADTQLWDFTVFFPGSTWMETLPEIYVQSDHDGFLDRYLGIFQTIYEDMEDRISRVPGMLDVDRADAEFLDWMAGWLDIEERYRWPREKLRILIKKGFSLYRKRGTREGILEFVEMFTGERPILVEWGQYRDVPHDERLYPDNPYTLMVFVREEVFSSDKERRMLASVIEDVLPVYMTLKLVVMRPYVFLDDHTYLGINSCIGHYKKGRLDGKLALSFSTLN